MAFERFKKVHNTNILVIGDIMLDHYVYGVCNRISPEAPVPIIEFRSDSKMLGGAGNVIKNLKKFGTKCDLITVIGDDETGNDVLELLKDQNIDINFIIKDYTRKTTSKQRFIASNQQLIRIDKESQSFIDRNIQNIILEKILSSIEKYDIVLISDYLKGVLTNDLCQEIISICRKNKVLVIVDPKGVDFQKYSFANIIKPNLKEFEQIIQSKLANQDSIKTAANMLKKELKLDALIVTLGADGIFYSDKLDKFCPTLSSNVIDVSGAGDTVLASLGVCLACNFNIEEACLFANAAASIVISKFGTEATNIDDVIEVLISQGHSW
jgi:D-beta-D-heptose 7-phosphate kinase/D-beta-D-heptose 1-phosphate adenosyltransferase